MSPRPSKNKGDWYLNVLLQKIAQRKLTIKIEFLRKQNGSSLEHKYACDQELASLYVHAEKEMQKLYSISYDINGHILVSNNLI